MIETNEKHDERRRLDVFVHSLILLSAFLVDFVGVCVDNFSEKNVCDAANVAAAAGRRR